MLSFHYLQPFSLPQLSFITASRPISLISLWLLHGDCHVSRKTNTKLSSCIVHAAERDSQQYDIDPDKAKEALRKLDQQLQSLSKKQVSPPKIKASDVKLTRDKMTEEVLEIPGSILSYVTVALLVFTIFYNILFNRVIKPSIDVPDTESSPSMTTVERESPEAAVLQLLPLTPDIFMQGYGGG